MIQCKDDGIQHASPFYCLLLLSPQQPHKTLAQHRKIQIIVLMILISSNIPIMRYTHHAKLQLQFLHSASVTYAGEQTMQPFRLVAVMHSVQMNSSSADPSQVVCDCTIPMYDNKIMTAPHITTGRRNEAMLSCSFNFSHSDRH
mmetsp:Transcript_4886/g.8344  ORF Transcript_4886/g.8344 Transcript_4886/m.8344 type:complete len:144 (+) Transcript_4886:141-572(+)